MNLFSKKVFQSADEAFSMHTGLMLRMLSDDFRKSKKAPQDVGYDAFVSQAGEDKDDVARTLAK